MTRNVEIHTGTGFVPRAPYKVKGPFVAHARGASKGKEIYHETCARKKEFFQVKQSSRPCQKPVPWQVGMASDQ